MDDLGELMVLVAVAWFFCGDASEVWPYCLGLFILGAAMYFLDRAINRPMR